MGAAAEFSRLYGHRIHGFPEFCSGKRRDCIHCAEYGEDGQCCDGDDRERPGESRILELKGLVSVYDYAENRDDGKQFVGIFRQFAGPAKSRRQFDAHRETDDESADDESQRTEECLRRRLKEGENEDGHEQPNGRYCCISLHITVSHFNVLHGLRELS